MPDCNYVVGGMPVWITLVLLFVLCCGGFAVLQCTVTLLNPARFGYTLCFAWALLFGVVGDAEAAADSLEWTRTTITLAGPILAAAAHLVFIRPPRTQDFVFAAGVVLMGMLWTLVTPADCASAKTAPFLLMVWSAGWPLVACLHPGCGDAVEG